MIRNSKTGYDYLLKNNRLLFSRTIDYCFPYCFGIFRNLIIPKQGIEMQIFFLNGLWRFLKNGHLPVKLHSSAPPGFVNIFAWSPPSQLRVFVRFENSSLPRIWKLSNLVSLFNILLRFMLNKMMATGVKRSRNWKVVGRK